jgi:uncharacterized protein YcbX
MLGEDLQTLELDERGVIGDRVWSVRTSRDKIGSGKSTRRFEAVVGLLDVRTATRDGAVLVTFPEGDSYRVDDPTAADRLSRRLGQPLTFARETEVSHFDDGPVSLMGSGSIDALARARGQHIDPARFRANIVLDTGTAFVEDEWIGHRVEIGSAVLDVVLPSPRCVMVNMATADLPAQPGNLAAIGDLHDQCIGVIARVVQPGEVSVGDEVTVR